VPGIAATSASRKLAVVDEYTGDEKKHQVELLMAGSSGHELGSLAWQHTLSGTGEGTVLSSATSAIRGSPTFASLRRLNTSCRSNAIQQPNASVTR
jgi:hypothetical protein